MGDGSASRPGCTLPLGKTRYPLYRRLGGLQGRSGQVWKISAPPGFDPRTVQPVGSRYTDYATRPTLLKKAEWNLYKAQVGGSSIVLQRDISCNTYLDGVKVGTFAKLPTFTLSSLCFFCFVFYAYSASLGGLG